MSKAYFVSSLQCNDQEQLTDLEVKRSGLPHQYNKHCDCNSVLSVQMGIKDGPITLLCWLTEFNTHFILSRVTSTSEMLQAVLRNVIFVFYLLDK